MASLLSNIGNFYIGLNIYIKLIITIICCALFVNRIVPYVKKIAFFIGAVAKPNERTVHKSDMPSMGGLAIYMGFIVGFMIFGILDPQFVSIQLIASILIGTMVIIFTGVIDDMYEIPAKIKLIGEVIAAAVVVFYGGVGVYEISAFGIHLKLGVFGSLLSIVWIIGITNAINLIDGLDGLSAGVSAIFFTTVGILAISGPYWIIDTLTASICAILVGSIIGFLRHNFHPASIFMGDTGALFLGFMVSTVSLLGFGYKNATIITLFVPIVILAVPILDTLLAMVRRFLKGKSISEADREHLHHQLLDLNFGHKNTVIVIYILSSLFSLMTILFTLSDSTAAATLLFVVVLIFGFLIEKTSIISDDFKPVAKAINRFIDRYRKRSSQISEKRAKVKERKAAKKKVKIGAKRETNKKLKN